MPPSGYLSQIIVAIKASRGILDEVSSIVMKDVFYKDVCRIYPRILQIFFYAPEEEIYKRKQASKNSTKRATKTKRKKTFFRSWSLSWSSSCFFVFFYKFPPQATFWQPIAAPSTGEGQITENSLKNTI